MKEFIKYIVILVSFIVIAYLIYYLHVMYVTIGMM